MMQRRLLLIVGLVAVLVSSRGSSVESPLILLSLDGFRWDYLEQFASDAPTLRDLRKNGSTTRALIPVFPSNTFPNHYTIVTGLYPSNHGIVNNDFFDPAAGAFFHFNQPASNREPRWWRGEPIWATAIRQGRKSATSFWVGSEAVVSGVRPTFWRPFDGQVSFETRLEELVNWMRLPPSERPAVVTFYLEDTNGAGHRYGPDTPEVGAAVRLCDERIALLLARLRAEKIEPNLVIVSDHGMTSTSPDRVVFIEDHVERTAVQIEAEGSAAGLRPLHGDAAALVQKFAGVPHVRAYRAEDLPARFRFGDNPRIAPVWVLPDEGWHVLTRPTFARFRTTFKARGYLVGDHGYDPALPNMHGILIAHGPAFRRGVEAPATENVHVYNLLCAVLRLSPAQNDGDDRLVRAFLQD